MTSSRPLSHDWIIDLRLNGVKLIGVTPESFEFLANHDAFIRTSQARGSIFGVRVMKA